MSEKIMKYDLRPEFQKYRWIHLPTQRWILKTANALMPVIQRGRKQDFHLQSRRIKIGECSADLIQPKVVRTNGLLIYYHGGAFLIKAAAYHKNLVQTYALRADCAVLFVDYRLAPEYKFPIPVKDCFRAYSWALKNLSFDRVVIGGDSAGADLAMSVMLLAKKKQMRMPDGQMLIYPGCAGDPTTESIHRYTDTPLWNSVLNRKALALYGNEKDDQHPLFRPIFADSFSGFPKAYIEAAEFDCLHDAGVQIAERYRKDGVSVTRNDTKRTMHGYDIAEKSPYVRKQVDKRIRFLKGVFRDDI
ncbi:MAG: alpha/beta hydrolase [Lachnospiraceae bacterium]|nr:alpha/beta hydrolase [Lachnospiraceae bacterium]